MIPGQPTEAGVSAEAGRGVEVVARDEDGLDAGRQVNRDNRVRGLAVGDRVVLTHADQAVSRPIQDGIGIAHPGRRRQRLRLLASADTVELLIREVREDDDASGHEGRTTAIFVDPGARVERRRDNVAGRAVRLTPNDHDTARLRGSCLGPIDRVPVEAHQSQPDATRDDQI